ncbi:PspA/IM30 family protein [Sorangium sp. So ce1128]
MANDGERGGGPRAPIGRILGKAATGTINLAVAGGAAVGAAALHSWPVLALGGVAYAALVAWDMASPRFWKQALAAPPAELPDPDKLLDQSTRDAVRAILSARKELAAVLEETSDEVKGHLGMTLSSITELEQRSARLISRAEELARYLAKVSAEPVRQEIARLDEKARAARDPAARREYESARVTREEQLKALDDIAGARERVVANLSRIVATLEGLPAKIVRMRALDAQAMDQLSGSMHDELEHMNGELKAFEETLKTLGEMASA